jgi:hypothetical protein
MKITEKELRALIREAISKKVKTLNEGSDFTARRQLMLSAANTTLNFETEIIKLLDLVSPDKLTPEGQEVYRNAVEKMGDGFKQVVNIAVDELSRLPRNSQGE